MVRQINIGDKRFHLTAISEPHRKIRPNGTPERWVAVECDCVDKTVKEIRVTEFGSTVSCGCAKLGVGGPPIKYKITVGQIFGRWSVIEELRVDGKRFARCRCLCGNIKNVAIVTLFSGESTSCGCYNKEVTRERMLNREAPKGEDHPGYKHGLALKGNKNPHYSRWQLMMRRCYNEADAGFSNYGALGIKVYEPWHDVVTFCREIEKLLGPRPIGSSIDRIDPFGDYAPDNVRWATDAEQGVNKKLSHKNSDTMASRVRKALREKFPGHSQDWYVAYIERASLAAAGVLENELPELPDK